MNLTEIRDVSLFNLYIVHLHPPGMATQTCLPGWAMARNEATKIRTARVLPYFFTFQYFIYIFGKIQI